MPPPVSYLRTTKFSPWATSGQPDAHHSIRPVQDSFQPNTPNKHRKKPSRQGKGNGRYSEGQASPQNKMIASSSRTEEKSKPRLLACTQKGKAERCARLSCLKQSFFPLTAKAFSDTIRPPTTKTDGKVVKRSETGCGEVRNKW